MQSDIPDRFGTDPQSPTHATPPLLASLSLDDAVVPVRDFAERSAGRALDAILAACEDGKTPSVAAQEASAAAKCLLKQADLPDSALGQVLAKAKPTAR